MKNFIFHLAYLVSLCLISSTNSLGQNYLFVETNGIEYLNQEELGFFQRLGEDDQNLKKWVITLNPIEHSISGTILTFTLPDQAAPIVFDLDYVHSNLSGASYYWAGRNGQGSTFRVSKSGGGTIGNIYHAPSNSYYTFTSLSSNKAALIKTPGNGLQFNTTECLLNGPDDEIDTIIDNRSGCQLNEVRVLVLYTTLSVGAGGFNPLVVGPAIVNELNSTAGLSGLTNSQISFKLADTRLLTGFVSTTDIDDDVDALVNNATAQGIRNETYADVVILLTANVYPGVAGVAKAIKCKNQNAYCISEISPAATTFTGSHEISHLIGARHQRCLACGTLLFPSTGCDPSTDYHGIAIGGMFGTLMYQLTCGLPRVGRWSNPAMVAVVGTPPITVPTGSPTDDNSKIIVSRADNVACFRGPLPGSTVLNNVEIFGPTFICSGSSFGYFTATVNNPNAIAPFTYKWQQSANGISGWSDLATSTSSYFALTNTSQLSNPFFARVIVTDAANKIGISQVIKIDILSCGQGSDDRSANQVKYMEVFPNPTTDQLSITNVTLPSKLEILNFAGHLLDIRNLEQTGLNLLDVSNLPTGIYVLLIRNLTGLHTYKFIKQ